MIRTDAEKFQNDAGFLDKIIVLLRTQCGHNFSQYKESTISRRIAADVSEDRLSRYILDDAGGYRVKNDIREMVIFAQQNVIADPHFTRLDFVSCRNLFIYIESELLCGFAGATP